MAPLPSEEHWPSVSAAADDLLLLLSSALELDHRRRQLEILVQWSVERLGRSRSISRYPREDARTEAMHRCARAPAVCGCTR
jgi:hypothetical protein